MCVCARALECIDMSLSVAHTQRLMRSEWLLRPVSGSNTHTHTSPHVLTGGLGLDRIHRMDSAHGNVSVVVDRTISYCETSALRCRVEKKTAHNCGDDGGDSLSYFHCSVDVMKNIAKAHTLSRTCNRTIVHVRSCACACMLYFIYDRDSMFACCAFVSVRARAHTHTHDCDKP